MQTDLADSKLVFRNVLGEESEMDVHEGVIEYDMGDFILNALFKNGDAVLLSPGMLFLDISYEGSVLHHFMLDVMTIGVDAAAISVQGKYYEGRRIA